ncbi:MAG: S8 family serine peptidase [Actinomycetes bacterium]
MTVGYTAPSDLRGLHVLRSLPTLRIAEVEGVGLRDLRQRPGIRSAQRGVARVHLGEPVLTITNGATAASEWAYAATRENLVPPSVFRAASAITIAVVDTGADLSAPDLAAKSPVGFNSVTNDSTVTDIDGHGTFVASLAGGSVTNGDGMAGFGGDVRLLIVEANRNANTFTDFDEAAGIVWAVDHGAQILNLSIGGSQTSQIERDAIDYAVAHGVLVVAAAGNGGMAGNEPSYPAALLTDHGLAVGSSAQNGLRASFSTSAAYVSLLAPGVHVLGALPAAASQIAFPRTALDGTTKGIYGYSSGTSYSAPQVAGAAALVWAANPSLTADQVAQTLELSATGGGVRRAAAGYGVLDVAAAVAKATGQPVPPLKVVAVTATVKKKTTASAREAARARRVSLGVSAR